MFKAIKAALGLALGLAVTNTARPRNSDPYSAFRFRVSWDNAGLGVYEHHGGFNKVDGLEDESETIEYREGTDDTVDRKMPGKLKTSRVTLSRGMSDNDQLREWRQAVAAVMTDEARPVPPVGSGRSNQASDDPASFRRDVLIELIDRTGRAVRGWQLLNAYPAKWSGDNLDAGSNNAAMESIELEHEGLVHLTRKIKESGYNNPIRNYVSSTASMADFVPAS